MRFYIGIDPPKGYAIWDAKEGIFVSIATMNFWGLVETIDRAHTAYNLGYMEAPARNPCMKVIIEDPAQNRGIYGRHWKHDQGHKMTRIAKNVGMNLMTATLLIEFCRRKEIPVEAVRPTKRSLTKMKIDRFQKLTGYMGKTSEHGRDAAMLVWGRKP